MQYGLLGGKHAPAQIARSFFYLLKKMESLVFIVHHLCKEYSRKKSICDKFSLIFSNDRTLIVDGSLLNCANCLL